MTLSVAGTRLRQCAIKRLATIFCLAISIAGHTSINAYGQDSAELTAAKVFAELPLEVTEMIRPSTRLDMIDYWQQADSLLTATNALGEECRIVAAAPDYMKVAVTPVSTLEIKLLKAGKQPIAMTLYTTGDPEAARDTEVRFFDSDMNPLNAGKYFNAPKLTDFFTLKGSGLTESDLAEKVPYMAVEYTTGTEDSPLRAKLTTLRVISEEDSDLLTPMLTQELTAEWKGKYDFKK